MSSQAFAHAPLHVLGRCAANKAQRHGYVTPAEGVCMASRFGCCLWIVRASSLWPASVYDPSRSKTPRKQENHGKIKIKNILEFTFADRAHSKMGNARWLNRPRRPCAWPHDGDRYLWMLSG